MMSATSQVKSDIHQTQGFIRIEYTENDIVQVNSRNVMLVVIVF